MLLLLPATAPPMPPMTAPVPALEAVFDGATPEEQPLQNKTALAVARQANCLVVVLGEERSDMGKICLRELPAF
jgi:hypothetical protein